jgi:hypothetical protein
MPGVRIDNERLVILSVGVPIGLGTYWARVHRDWSARSKRVEIAAAAAGALTGAWLRFHATEGLLALLTAIAGALAGANLTLILPDPPGISPPQLRRRRMRRSRTWRRSHPVSGGPDMACIALQNLTGDSATPLPPSPSDAENAGRGALGGPL